MIIGIAGKAGAGKDTLGAAFVRRGFVRVAFADVMKRICREAFDFTDDQLFGAEKDLPDARWTRPSGVALTPRFALQRLGSEWGRACHPDVWSRYALRVAKQIEGGGWEYLPDVGLVAGLRHLPPPRGVVITDVRFENECRAIKTAFGTVILIQRPGGGFNLDDHDSERLQIPPSLIDHTIINNGPIENLDAFVSDFLRP